MYSQLYTAASGLIAGERTVELTANNLANVGTPAFRPDRPVFSSYLDAAVAARAGGSASAAPQEVWVPGSWIDEAPGPLERTDNPLDLALEGPGWFRVATPGGERLTRAGAFQRSGDGMLTTEQGYAVLDERGQPVRLGEGTVSVGADGTLTREGQPIGRLGLVAAPANALTREGSRLWRAEGPVRELGPEEVAVMQGFLEGSGVQPTEELIRLVSAQRMFEMHQRIVDLTYNNVARRALELSGTR